MKKIAILFILLGLFFCFISSVYAITFCYDYSYYMLTGKDTNRMDSVTLRKELRKIGYKDLSFTTEAKDPAAQDKLWPYDVIIIGDSHSGVVNSQGLIDHFIQQYDSNSHTKVFSIDQALVSTTFYRNCKLIDIVNFSRTTEHGTKIYPYASCAVVVWRLDLSGAWRMGGPYNVGKPCKIVQTKNSLVFFNENNLQSKGAFKNGSTVIALDWAGGLQAEITNEGNRINWKNNTWWVR